MASSLNYKELSLSSSISYQKDDAGFASINQYLIGEKLSKRLWQVLDLDTGEDLAIKSYSNPQEFHKELKVIQALPPHQHILQYREAIFDSSHPKQYLVMELAEGGQITNVDAKTGQCDRNYSSTQASELILQLANGILHMHNNGILHRDLKPENVLLDKDGQVKIADFGESIVLEDDTDDTVSLSGRSIAYSCPEGFTREEYSGKAADVWGIGVVAYCILFARLPFWGKTHSQLMEQVLHAALEIPRTATAQARHFLTRCLEKDPSRRINMSQLMTHPWLTVPSLPFFVPSFPVIQSARAGGGGGAGLTPHPPPLASLRTPRPPIGEPPAFRSPRPPAGDRPHIANPRRATVFGDVSYKRRPSEFVVLPSIKVRASVQLTPSQLADELGDRWAISTHKSPSQHHLAIPPEQHNSSGLCLRLPSQKFEHMLAAPAPPKRVPSLRFELPPENDGAGKFEKTETQRTGRSAPFLPTL